MTQISADDSGHEGTPDHGDPVAATPERITLELGHITLHALAWGPLAGPSSCVCTDSPTRRGRGGTSDPN